MARRRRNDVLLFPSDEELPQRMIRLLREVTGARLSAAEAVMEAFPMLRALETATPTMLVELGLTRKQAESLKAAFELVRVVDSVRTPGDVDGINNDHAVVYWVGRHMTGLDREHAVVILLNARNKVIEGIVVGSGGISEVNVDMGVLMRAAIRYGASSMIFVHNHPSGDPFPSTADDELTKRLKEAGRIIGIPLVDHLIIAGWKDNGPRHYSYAAGGRL